MSLGEAAAPRLIAIPEGTGFRFPDESDEDEAHVAAANRADAAYSTQELDTLLPGIADVVDDRVEFLTVDRQRLSRIFDLDLLDRLVDHGLDRRQMALSNWQFLGDTASAVSPVEDAIHPALLARAIRDGGRLALAGVEQSTPQLRRLAEHLGRRWRCRVSIRVAVGVGAFAGTKVTPLSADHLLIAVHGFRHVTADGPDGAQIHSGPLGPGHALYLPAGVTVTTNTVNELFVSLEVTLERPRPRALLPLAAALPMHEQLDWPGSLDELRNSLLARWCAALPSRPGGGLSSLLAPVPLSQLQTHSVRSTLTGGWCIPTTINAEPDTMALVGAGVGVQIPRRLLPIVASALAGPPRPLRDIASASSDSERLIALLVTVGALEVGPSDEEIETPPPTLGVADRG